MITIISGTNRLNSSTLKLSRYYQKQFTKLGADTTLFSLENLPPNLIVSDLYGARSEDFSKILSPIEHSEKLVFVIPEYNGSFPGVLKTFLDATKYPDSFQGKKVALVGLSSGKYGNIRGIEHFTGVCHYMQMHVLPLKIHIPYIRQEINEEGDLFQEETVLFTQMQIENFLKF
jgi:chromate reductase